MKKMKSYSLVSNIEITSSFFLFFYTMVIVEGVLHGGGIDHGGTIGILEVSNL